MAGKPGMHKKVLNPAAVERIRERIQADRIIKKLENHVLDGEEMTSTQVAAALGLLKKRVPDLSQMSMSADVNVRHAKEMTDDELAAIAAGGSADPTDAPEVAGEPE